MSGSGKKQNVDLNKLSFEDALGRLDQTVQALEKGGLTLSDATDLFEDGIKLARRCSELLATAELRISRIQTAYGEQMRMIEEALEDDDSEAE